MNLNQVTVHSRDLVAAAAFYQKLGLKLIVDSIPRYARFECPDGDSTFSLHRDDVEESAGAPRSNIVLYFECEDLDAKVAALKLAGVEFELDPTDQDWGWRESHLRDCDGNKIILFFGGQNRKYPAWRVATA